MDPQSWSKPLEIFSRSNTTTFQNSSRWSISNLEVFLQKKWAIWSNILDIVRSIITIWSVDSRLMAKNGHRSKNEPLNPSRSWDIYKNVFGRWCIMIFEWVIKLYTGGVVLFFSVNPATKSHDPNHWIYLEDHAQLCL